ncbi:MAG TPA: hypothetical protein VGA69_11235 [Nitriliruptorales bacterium]
MAARPRDWARQYPPLAAALVAVLVAVFVLPSALNVPQSNPTQTLEFAPVPPQDDQPPPPDSSNVESLSLGSSSSVTGDARGGADGGPGLPPPPEVPAGLGDRPVTKRCVQTPQGPRQTEDPLAPPCVAHFEGDNGGATYRGVTAEQITVLITLTGGGSAGPYCDAVTSRGTECRPSDRYFDLFDPPEDDDPYPVRAFRVFQEYFNTRYQTYGRTAHFWVYFTPHRAHTPETRRAEANDNVARREPFAVIGYPGSLEDDYLRTVARHGVLNFGSHEGRPASFFREFPGLIWSYTASIDERAKLYGELVCTQVVGRPVSFSGNGDAGQPRRLGLMRTTDDRYPGVAHFTDVVRGHVEGCGGEFATEVTFPVAGRVHGTRQQTGESNATVAPGNIATLGANDVTTVIWPQAYETQHTEAAANANYLPEWVIAGDGAHEGYLGAQQQDQGAFDRHAMVVTGQTLEGETEETECWRAFEEAAPGHPDAAFTCGLHSGWYHDLRQLFTGIQVAGPQLTPESIDEGFHAIPAVPSSDPRVPACFYDPGDYTCVKDGVAMWWDANSTAPGASSPGCWRMPEGGQRYFGEAWPRTDAAARWAEQDPCNGYSGSLNFTF